MYYMINIYNYEILGNPSKYNTKSIFIIEIRFKERKWMFPKITKIGLFCFQGKMIKICPKINNKV